MVQKVPRRLVEDVRFPHPLFLSHSWSGSRRRRTRESVEALLVEPPRLSAGPRTTVPLARRVRFPFGADGADAATGLEDDTVGAHELGKRA